jgi:hypothetical protein
MGDYGPDCALTYTCRSFDGFLEVAVGSHGWKSCDPEDHNAGFLTMHCAEEGWNTNTYKDHCYTHTENVTTSTTEGTSWSVYVKVFSVAFDTPNATSVADNGATLAQDLAINTDLPTEQLLFFQTDELTRANEGVVVLELACAHDYLLGSNLTHENVYDGVFDYLTTASFLTLPESWQALNMAQEQNSYSYYVAVTVHQCLDGTLQLVACDDILAQELVTEEEWWAVVVETDSYLWAAIALCSLMCCTVPAFTLWFRKKHQDKLAATEGYLGGNTELDEL